jgi:hypothetical protein
MFVGIRYLAGLIIWGWLGLAWASQLDASLSSYQIAIGETVTLHVTLSAETIDSEPDISPLQTDFRLIQRSLNQATQIINHKVSRQITWIYQLEPLRAGELTIPAISLPTTNLRTKPLRLQVTAADAPRKDHIELNLIIDQQQLYLYQPTLLKLRLSHLGDVRDPLPIMPSDGLILEQLNSMTTRREVVDGRNLVVHEIDYLLTPMRVGELKLDNIRVRANKWQDNRGRSTWLGFDNYQSIVLTAPKQNLHILPPQSSLSEWLPLHDLQLTANWEQPINKPVNLGVPLILQLEINAYGMGAQPFAELSKFIPEQNQFRWRHSRPETKRQLVADTMLPITKLNQSISIIPLQEGNLELPAIRIPWWDLRTQQLKWAEIPAQQLSVQNTNLPQSETSETTVIIKYQSGFNNLQYLLLGMAVLALLLALWQMQDRKIPVRKNYNFRHFKQQLMQAKTAMQIKQLLQQYAQQHLDLPANSSLLRIANAWQHKELTYLIKELDQHLYAAEYTNFDLITWKQAWLAVMPHETAHAPTEQSHSPNLNPL